MAWSVIVHGVEGEVRVAKFIFLVDNIPFRRFLSHKCDIFDTDRQIL